MLRYSWMFRSITSKYSTMGSSMPSPFCLISFTVFLGPLSAYLCFIWQIIRMKILGLVFSYINNSKNIYYGITFLLPTHRSRWQLMIFSQDKFTKSTFNLLYFRTKLIIFTFSSVMFCFTSSLFEVLIDQFFKNL